MATLDRLFSSRNIGTRTNVIVYSSLVVSVVMYGCEALTLKVVQERRLHAFENKCYRRILKIPNSIWYLRCTFSSVVMYEGKEVEVVWPFLSAYFAV